MAILVRLHTARDFQSTLEHLVNDLRDIKSRNAKMFKDVSITARRVVAAALLAASDDNPETLYKLMSEISLPGRGHKDETPLNDVFQKTIHISYTMSDYTKHGASTLNRYFLGPIEDKERNIDPKNFTHHRLTDRQYLHLAVYYFATLSENHKILTVISSAHLHPFLWKGMTKPEPMKHIPDRSTLLDRINDLDDHELGALASKIG